MLPTLRIRQLRTSLKYKDAYNGETPNQFAADAYDGVMVLAELMKKEGITADMSASDICDKLKRLSLIRTSHMTDLQVQA